MKMKNMLIVLTAFVCTALAGCGSHENPDDPVINETTVSATEVSTTSTSNSTVMTAVTEALHTDVPAVSDTPNGDAVIPSNPDSVSSEQPKESNGKEATLQTSTQSTGENVMIDGTDADGNLIEPEPTDSPAKLVPNDSELEHDEHGLVIF